MVTYNHERYLAKALDSVLAQETDYSFTIYIGEDKSTDGTHAICDDYVKRYPGKIVLVTSENNVGANANGIRMYKACLDSGAKYTALLEGDDYWTSTKKLQQQIDLLEKDDSLAACFHDGIVIDSNGNVTRDSLVRFRRTLTQKDLIEFGGLYPSASLLLRTHCLSALPDLLAKVHGGDRWVGITISGFGNMGFIDEKMCAYRLHGTGMYSTANELVRAERQYRDFMMLKGTNDYWNKYRGIICKKLAENLSVMASHYALAGEKEKYRDARKQYVKYMPWRMFDVKRLLSHVLFPKLYKKVAGN